MKAIGLEGGDIQITLTDEEAMEVKTFIEVIGLIKLPIHLAGGFIVLKKALEGFKF